MSASRALLPLALLACLAASLAADGPSDWAGWFERPGGPDPFRRWEYGDGLVLLRLPADWKALSRRQGSEEQLILHPPNADPTEPHTAYVVLLVRLPPGTDLAAIERGLPAMADRMRDRIVAADATRRTRPAGEPREVRFLGRPAREHDLAGYAGQVPTSTTLRCALAPQAVLSILHIRPRDDRRPWAQLWAHMDAGLVLGAPRPPLAGTEPRPFTGHGWRVRLPADWTGEELSFGGSPAWTLAPRRLLHEPDPQAVRVIVAVYEGEKLAKLDHAQLAANIAANLARQNPQMKPVSTDRLEVDGLPATRQVLKGSLRDSALAAAARIVVAKEPRRAFLILALGGEGEMERALPALEALTRSFERTERR